LEFYRLFGFVEFNSWNAEDNSIQIKKLKLDGMVLEIFKYQNYEEIPKTALDTVTDLPIVGTKHFALGVENIYEAKEFVINNNIKDIVEIKEGRLGKPYFWISDPDGILVEIIERDNI